MSLITAVSPRPAVRSPVRPAIAGRGFLPIDVPGLSFWVDPALSLLTPNAMKAAALSDISGNGNHATQSTSSLQPVVTRQDDLSNELFSSEVFESTWTLANGLSAEDGVELPGPFGVPVFASKITSDGTTGGRLFQSWSLKRTGQFILYGFFHDGTATAMGANSAQANSSSWTVTENSDGVITTGLQNGWRICYQIFTVSGTGTTIEAFFYPCSNGFAAIAAGAYGYIWGAGLMESSAFRGYAPTIANLAYAGINGNASLKFDESDDLLTVPAAYNSAQIFGTTKKTIIAAFRMGKNVVSNKRVLVGPDSGAASSWGPFIGASNALTWKYRTNTPGNATLTSAGSALAAGSVHLTALRHNGASIKPYIDSLTIDAVGDPNDGYAGAGETSTGLLNIGGPGSGISLLAAAIYSGYALSDYEFGNVMRYFGNRVGVSL